MRFDVSPYVTRLVPHSAAQCRDNCDIQRARKKTSYINAAQEHGGKTKEDVTCENTEHPNAKYRGTARHCAVLSGPRNQDVTQLRIWSRVVGRCRCVTCCDTDDLLAWFLPGAGATDTRGNQRVTRQSLFAHAQTWGSGADWGRDVPTCGVRSRWHPPTIRRPVRHTGQRRPTWAKWASGRNGAHCCRGERINATPRRFPSLFRRYPARKEPLQTVWEMAKEGLDVPATSRPDVTGRYR